MVTRTANPKLAAKLFPKKTEKIDTRKEDSPYLKNNNVLMEAFYAWNSLDNFREKARRNKEYTFGDQWSDKIKNPDGCGWITEKTHIQNQGNIPLVNNRIRGIVRSVLGVFSSTQTEPVCVSRERDKQNKGEMMSATLQYVYQLNKLWELDRRNLEYFLISGIAAFKSTFGWRDNKMDVWTDLVNYNNIFFDNNMTDPRHRDCHLIGEIHEVGLFDVMSQFAEGNPQKAKAIREIYNHCDRDRTMNYLRNLTDDVAQHRNFFIPDDETRCRVIEVWRKESKERLQVHDRLSGDFYKVETTDEPELIAENGRRIEIQLANGIEESDMKLIEYEWFIDNYWYFYFLSPQGDILKEGETPYWHESHPYSFKVYPFYDGQVFPFVSDFIDQQRYINRLITLQDFMMRASAKGVLAIHEDSIPEGMRARDFADEWAVFNGVIVYKGKPGVPLPQQIASSSNHVGVYDMLSIQLKLLEDISGVHGALQGQQPLSGTPASLYMQQTQNSTTSLTDLFESYREVREDRDMKNLKLIQQSYTEPKYININSSGKINETIYDPGQVRNTEFDLSITESTASPAYRMVMNDFLMQMFTMGQVTLEELLENGTFPFADKLLQSIQARKQEAMAAQEAAINGQEPQQSGETGFIPEEIQAAIQQNLTPEMIQQFAVNNDQ